MAKKYQRRNLAKARRAKKRKQNIHKAAAAKRTTVYQIGKKKGITADIGIEGMKITTTTKKTPITTGITAQNKHKLRPITARQRRKSIQRSQLKIKKGTLEVRRAVSQRARTHPMEAAGVGQPQTPQQLLMESTAIRKFKYWIKEKRLKIWFVEKGVYDYYDVPESTVIELSQAQSKGRYFYYNIRTTFEFKRIR